MYQISILLLMDYIITIRRDKKNLRNGEVYFVMTEIHDKNDVIVLSYDHMEKKVYINELGEQFMNCEYSTISPNGKCNVKSENEKKLNGSMKKLVISQEMIEIKELLKRECGIDVIIKKINEGNKKKTYNTQFPIPNKTVFSIPNEVFSDIIYQLENEGKMNRENTNGIMQQIEYDWKMMVEIGMELFENVFIEDIQNNKYIFTSNDILNKKELLSQQTQLFIERILHLKRFNELKEMNDNNLEKDN